MTSLLLAVCLAAAPAGAPPSASPPAPALANCLACHGRLTPRIVEDWKLSRHFKEEVG